MSGKTRDGSPPWCIQTRELSLRTRGRDDVQDITPEVQALVRASGLRQGLATVFIPGSTASVTTMEFEPGSQTDLRAVLESLMPFGRDWAHHRTWGDDNGGSHLRSSLLGPSLTIPVMAGELVLGTWQQVVVIDHDTRPRTRRVVLQIMGSRSEPEK